MNYYFTKWISLLSVINMSMGNIYISNNIEPLNPNKPVIRYPLQDLNRHNTRKINNLILEKLQNNLPLNKKNKIEEFILNKGKPKRQKSIIKNIY